MPGDDRGGGHQEKGSPGFMIAGADDEENPDRPEGSEYAPTRFVLIQPVEDADQNRQISEALRPAEGFCRREREDVGKFQVIGREGKIKAGKQPRRKPQADENP